MARNLTLNITGREYSLTPVKIERSKLYGWCDLRVTTSDGNLCRTAGINSDGITLVESGCIKAGMVTDDGQWMDRDCLNAMLHSGQPAQFIPSSFDAAIILDTEASVIDLLNLNVTSVYQLKGDEAINLAGLIGEKMYRFPFNYRGGYEQYTAIILAEGLSVYILTGTEAKLEYIGFNQAGILDDVDGSIDLDDELDFSMM